MGDASTPPGPPARLPARVRGLLQSDFGKAAGLAGAMIVSNVISLGSTVVFARLLDDYGSLAALISYYLILSVAGQAMQVATAREAVLGNLGTGPQLAATLRTWSIALLGLTAVLAVVSVLAREPIAAAVGVEEAWGAAIGLPAGVLWLLLSILRGGLQGIGDYRSVAVSLIAEAAVRLLSGAALAGVGLDVTGAYLGTPISLIVVGVWCALQLRRQLGTPEPHAPPALRLTDHVARAWAAICGLIVIAVLQNIDVIAAKHQFSDDVASSYGATAVAAKVLVWVAMGAGFYLVPETSRRHAEGEDTRPVLARAMAIVLVCAVPVLAIFAVFPRLLLRLAFGEDRLLAADSLIVLGTAFTLLSLTYLGVQYLLALRRTGFLIPLAIVAAAEPVLLVAVAPTNPEGFAGVLLAIQAVATAIALTLAFAKPGGARRPSARRGSRRSAPPLSAAGGSTPPG